MSKYTAEQVRDWLQRKAAGQNVQVTDAELKEVADVIDALLRESESAKAAVTDEMINAAAYALAEYDGADPNELIWEGNPPEPWGEIWNRYEGNARAALEAVAPMLAPCSLNDAMNVVEHWALQGNTLSGDDAKRFHALADRIAPMLMADSNHCQCPACVDGIIHDADCAVHNEPAMPTGPCDCSKRASLDAAIFAGNPEPDAWISTVMCVGPDYGKEYYGKLPIQSLNPLYYKHTKLYKVPPPMLVSARVPEGWYLVPVEPTEDMVKAVYPWHWYEGPGHRLKITYKKMLAAAPKPEKE